MSHLYSVNEILFPRTFHYPTFVLICDWKILEKHLNLIIIHLPILVNSLTTKKQTTNFSSEIFNVQPKLYHIKNSKTRGQTV